MSRGVAKESRKLHLPIENTVEDAYCLLAFVIIVSSIPTSSNWSIENIVSEFMKKGKQWTLKLYDP